MKRRVLVFAIALVLVIGMAGCGGEPDAEDAQAEVDASRAKVVNELRDASAALVSAGFKVDGLAGSYNNCGGGGLSPVTAVFGGGSSVSGVGGSVNERIEKVTRVLADSGWRVKAEGTGTSSRGEAHGRLTRNGLELSVDPSQLTTDKQAPVFGVSGDCVKVTLDQQADLLTGGSEPIEP